MWRRRAAPTAPGQLPAVADCQRILLAQKGQVDAQEVLALVGEETVACTAP